MRRTSPSSGSFASRSATIKITPQKKETKKPQANLLIRNTGGIGDMLMLTPVMRAIKEQTPNLPLIVCTTQKYGAYGTLFDILKNNPYVDKIITTNDLINYDFKKVYNFDSQQELGIEINPDNPYGHRVDIFLGLADLKTENKKVIYNVTPAEQEWARDWIQKNINPKKRTLIGIQVQATTTKRSWTEEKNLLLAFKILNTWADTSVLFFYEGLIERNPVIYPNIHYLIGLPIRRVAALINECNVMVVPDSGLLHIAGALNKKIVGIFGSTPPVSRVKYYPNATWLYLNYPCGPCWYNVCREQYKCMGDITAEMVMNKIAKQLNRDVQKTKKNILVYRMGGVGDLIMLSPSLKALKKFNPKAKLTLATKPEHIDVLKGLPYLDNVVAIKDIDFLEITVDGNDRVVVPKDGRDAEFDHIIDLRWKVECPEVGGNLSTVLYQTVNRIDMFARLMEIELDDKTCDVFLNKAKIPRIKKLIKYNPKFKWLGIQATCTSNLRTIPPDYIPEIIKRFSEIKNLKIVLFGRTEFWHGRKSDVNLKAIKGRKVINIIDSTEEVAELIDLISLMDYLVSPDSATLHIAGALKIPCLALFGNIQPYLRTQYYPTVTSMYPDGELYCIPCWDFYNPCIHYQHLPTREQPVSSECMRLFTPDRIFEKALEVFKFQDVKR